MQDDVAWTKVIAKNLPEPLDDVARVAYVTGWRKQEVLSLSWSDVDVDARRIRLRRENSKNEDPRVIVLTGDSSTNPAQPEGADVYRPLLTMRENGAP